MASADYLDRQKLTNTFNYLHFKGNPVYSLLNHPCYEESLLIKVYPEPCSGEILNCRWDDTYSGYKLEDYHLQFLVVSHDQSFIVVPTRLILKNEERFSVELPKTAFVVNRRQFPRFDCLDVKAELWQNGFHAEGELIDFSPQAFRLRVQSDPMFSFHCFNSEETAIIRLSSGDQVFYSGICACRRAHQNGHGRELVLIPTQDQIKRFKAMALRNPRKQGSASFSAVFSHPFTKRRVQREILDISTTGFSICNPSRESILMPGMVIPDMAINYAGILKIHCKAQVIYRKEEEEQTRFGLAILDMDMTGYNHLNQILNSIQGSEGGSQNEVNLDELWEFFFDADFIYPKKYKIIQPYKERFQDTYRRLYEEAPEIAKYFTYQRNGRIYGHIAMIKAYEKTWMVHHHAARPIGGRPIGLVVLKQLICYLKDLIRLPSANLDYVITYYRPENKFPARVFGGFAQNHDNPQHCSLHSFSYLTCPLGKTFEELPADWRVRECSDADLWEFEQFYRNHYSGLFVQIIKRNRRPNTKSIEETFAENGFVRRWRFFVLTHLDHLKAFIVAEESDAGINLSNLLNGFKIFVMDPGLQPEILFRAISEITGKQPAESISLLICPADYVDKADIAHEHKRYLLWILDMQYANEYIEFLGQKYRIRFD